MSTGRPTAQLIEKVMRDFKGEAPGRRKKSASRINAAATTARCLEKKSFTAPLMKLRQWNFEGPHVLSSTDSSYELECTLPSGFVEKVKDALAQKQHAITPVGLSILVIWGFKRPIDEHGPADNIFLGNESPVAAIEADAPMVTHGKVVVRRNDNIVALNVGPQIHHPVGIDIGIIHGRDRREIVPVRIVDVAVVVYVGLVQGLTVAIYHAVPQMDAVARQADDSLHHVKSGLGRREKHHDIAEMHVTIRKQWTDPGTARGELDAVHENVVADQQRVFHGTWGNVEG